MWGTICTTDERGVALSETGVALWAQIERLHFHCSLFSPAPFPEISPSQVVSESSPRMERAPKSIAGRPFI